MSHHHKEGKLVCGFPPYTIMLPNVAAGLAHWLVDRQIGNKVVSREGDKTVKLRH